VDKTGYNLGTDASFLHSLQVNRPKRQSTDRLQNEGIRWGKHGGGGRE
jgi:hypothetical protein